MMILIVMMNLTIVKLIITIKINTSSLNEDHISLYEEEVMTMTRIMKIECDTNDNDDMMRTMLGLPGLGD